MAAPGRPAPYLGLFNLQPYPELMLTESPNIFAYTDWWEPVSMSLPRSVLWTVRAQSACLLAPPQANTPKCGCPASGRSGLWTPSPAVVTSPMHARENATMQDLWMCCLVLCCVTHIVPEICSVHSVHDVCLPAGQAYPELKIFLVPGVDAASPLTPLTPAAPPPPHTHTRILAFFSQNGRITVCV